MKPTEEILQEMVTAALDLAAHSRELPQPWTVGEQALISGIVRLEDAIDVLARHIGLKGR